MPRAMNANAQTAISALLDSLGPSAVLSGADIPARNTNDWSPQPPMRPLAVVRPADTQVSARKVLRRQCASATQQVWRW